MINNFFVQTSTDSVLILASRDPEGRINFEFEVATSKKRIYDDIQLLRKSLGENAYLSRLVIDDVLSAPSTLGLYRLHSSQILTISSINGQPLNASAEAFTILSTAWQAVLDQDVLEI